MIESAHVALPPPPPPPPSLLLQEIVQQLVCTTISVMRLRLYYSTGWSVVAFATNQEKKTMIKFVSYCYILLSFFPVYHTLFMQKHFSF